MCVSYSMSLSFSQATLRKCLVSWRGWIKRGSGNGSCTTKTAGSWKRTHGKLILALVIVHHSAGSQTHCVCLNPSQCHFCNSRKLRFKWTARTDHSSLYSSSAEAQGKKSFMDICQEAGMVEVLPYHECDVISRTRPNYLHCLIRLQVQNVSARLPVFITGERSDFFPILHSLRLALVFWGWLGVIRTFNIERISIFVIHRDS